MLSRSERRKRSGNDDTDPSSHTLFCLLNTPQKIQQFEREHRLRKSFERRITYFRQKLERVTEERGVAADESLHNDLTKIMTQNAQTMAETLAPGSFARVFWDSQLRASTQKDARCMKWNPVMIRWCLYLRHLSSSAYETLRGSGVVRLPSQRTLRDYTYHTKAAVGFSKDVDEQLLAAANLPSCTEREKCVILIMDEMHIREDIVYDKHTGKNECTQFIVIAFILFLY